ncbi:PQQ-dependent sugar dehydrogenase [Wenzhouxiangella sp. EGI_FJ10409]|uniref:PQQ-dependent sugar dehydrogenase n=1 Tax=Wenzhouxiangella sp. EGI_FJ10409 TaxID=3243767 RepID=UPI0035DD32AE
MKRLYLPLAILTLAASPLFAQIPGDVSLEQVFAPDTFPGALGMVNAADGSDRLFVLRQGGLVEIIDDGQVLPDEFLDVTSLTSGGGEQGLLGLAFHPEFESNGLLYVNFTSNGTLAPSGDTVIAEYQVSAGDPDQVDPNSRRVLMTVVQDFSNHNGGNLAFGPDGYLYIGMGDGGSGGDPCNRAQTLDPDAIDTGGSCKDDPTAALLGKMMRLDVDSTTPAGSNNLCAADGDGSAEYAIPADNPFAQDDNACGEVWAYGLRNPWRWSFDRETGDLWIGDVGQGTWEEVDLEPGDSAGGVNYGWNVCEGEFATGSTSTPCPLAGSELPVLSYRRINSNCSVTGGYRYRGPVQSLTGTYVYADYCTGNIWFANEDGGDWSESTFSTEGFDLRSFGEDEDGNLYVVRSGGIFRFEGDTQLPDLLFMDRFEQ